MYCSYNREWKNPKHLNVPACGTDTSDTDAEHQVGGLGKLSHSGIALAHQHWVLQVILAGGFNVHCTQGSEASHKLYMRLASQRVQHRRANVTHSNMMRYVTEYMLFESVRLHHIDGELDEVTRKSPKWKLRVGLPLCQHGTTGRLKMGSDLEQVSSQRCFIHPQVRLTRFELLDLLCQQLQLPVTIMSYHSLNNLRWTFGGKLSMSNGISYWATDRNYEPSGESNHSRRRDVLFLAGTEAGARAGQHNALCCQATCFITVSRLDELCNVTGVPIPHKLKNEVHRNSLTFVLGRWLTAHPESLQRDSLGRPVCPGALQHTHCLWTFAKTPRPRKSMVDNLGNPTSHFHRFSKMFGDTPAAQRERWKSEQKAYYCLVTPSTIKTTANMSRIYVTGSMVQSDDWLETVNVT